MARRPRRKGGDPPAWGTLHPLIDLHGLTGGEARVKADAWLRARQAEGARTVIVVTGRGNRSGGLPVLRGEVGDLLARLEGSLVEAYELTEGGGGFRVTLRRLRAEPAPGAFPLAERRVGMAPPEVRRRAEEALWELGIAPTPALLQAEIQRILREEGRGDEETGEE